MRLVIIGYGYSARAVRAALVDDLAALAVTTRSPSKARLLHDHGIETVMFDGTHPSTHLSVALSAATHILMTADPSQDGDPFLLHHGLKEAGNLRWAGYLSTTGVYGDHGGGWVDETTPATPQSTRSVVRLAAEQAWQSAAQGVGAACAVFRLAGIYGPGRSALETVRDGTARRIVKPGQVFNRVHVEDIARVVAASAVARQGGVFNVSDDEPAPSQDVVAHACALLGLAPPPEVPFEQADLSPMGRSFYSENKRVANARIKGAFGPMMYPTYREGLAALVD